MRYYLTLNLATSNGSLRPENLKRSVDTILEKLRGKKRVDLFECARVDRKVSIEETIKTLSDFVREGKFDYIGTSETSAATLKRANAVRSLQYIVKSAVKC